MLITTLAAAGVFTTILSEKRTAEAEWSNRLSSFTTMMSAHARQSIGAADLVLRSITDSVNEQNVVDQASLRALLGSQKSFEMIRDAARSVPQIDVATIVAANGDVVNFTRSYPPPKINLSDRDYFQEHLKNPDLDIYLSVPVQNRGDGGWTFYLARKIRGPNGEMVGLVLTGLFSDFFSEFYKSVNMGPQHAMSLYRSDGRLLARYPVVRSALGASFANSATFAEALDNKEHGVRITQAARTTNLDNTETRIIAARRDKDYPLVVSTNVSEDLYLAHWRQSAWVLALAGGILCLVLGAATFVTVRLISALVAAQSEAMSAVEAKSRFVSTVSHELRTPLSAVISGSAQLLDHGLKAEPLKLAVLVSRSAQHLLLLINDILEFARTESGEEKIVTEPFDLRDVIDNAMEITKSLPKAERLAISHVIDPEAPAVLLGDKGRLTQVLLNLLSNGVKYTDAGEVALHAAYRDGVLSVSVCDTGRGISRADQARVFEPFERAANTSGDVAGTGLGLAICQRLAKLMGGEISLESEVGKGSVFTLRLPLPATDAVRESERRRQEQAVRVSGLRVLLAEDSSSIRMLMSLQLRKEGFDVTAVSNGREAVDAVRKSPPDLILMDIQMPEMDGLQATRVIRTLPGAVGRTPIIAVTAYANEDTLGQTIEAGMNAAINKPLNMAELKTRLGAMNLAAPETRGSGAQAGAQPGVEEKKAFQRDVQQQLDLLEAASLVGDRNALKRAAHTLQGLFRTFGHPDLAAQASKLNAAPDAGAAAAALRAAAQQAIRTNPARAA